VGLKLVAALNQRDLSSNVSADELAQLLRNYPEAVQTAAAPLLKRLGVDTAQQAERLAELAPLIEGGNADAGRELFFGKKAACSGCHTVAGQGGKVGPDLTQIGRIRTGRDLLEAVVFPSASFARGFRSYIVVTVEGKVHTGIISRESSDEIVLRTADLAEIRIPRNSIDELRESPVSIMPKGLEQTLSPAELRDLLAYVQSRK
jgi:putative heme-binding domain-containing protein